MNAQTEPTLIGVEYELRLTVRDPSLRSRLEELIQKIFEFLPTIVKAVPFREGRQGPRDLMLCGNGSRVYQDGRYYIEVAGAEVADPKETIAIERACELLIVDAIAKAARSLGIDPKQISLSRMATDYQGNFCGTHLNVLLRRYVSEELVDHLTSFIVSRFYSVAGGLGPGGVVMSHKNCAVQCESSNDTRGQRAIVDLRVENHSVDPYRRAHLAHCDQLMSEWGQYLTVATTALVLKMLDSGVCVGPAMKLENPVAALRLVDRDFSWRRPLPLACGLEASPLEINEHFLLAAESFVKGGGNEPWEGETVRQWRRAVDMMKKGPHTLSRSLDPYIKLALFNRLLRASGMSFKDFSSWSSALWILRPYIQNGNPPSRGLREYFRDRIPGVSFGLLEDRFARARLRWEDLGHAMDVWHKILTLDFNYHEVGTDGLYWRMAAAGAVNSRMVDERMIETAKHAPFSGSRAEKRVALLREVLKRPGAYASWTVVGSNDRRADLSDPFCKNATLTELKAPRARR